MKTVLSMEISTNLGRLDSLRAYEVFRSTISSARFDKVNKRIIFTKKYDLEGYQPIDYVGTLVSDNVITGRWNIGSYTGSWRAIRKN